MDNRQYTRGDKGATVWEKWIEFNLSLMLPKNQIDSNWDFKNPRQNEICNHVQEKYVSLCGWR